ncbi:hypothetical protein J2I47_04865 [Fibrella sp. HMF5335]|uniref:Uncharacterized protein n=1 Tax=Fibrella rubiginis TaxID=2817060 RepID=A0A939K0A2_9BACT|nr:hypothetical protein [Fibrella rubiginis]MBO0935872.1 hypothetical protein [Fibrella rubiginis]
MSTNGNGPSPNSPAGPQTALIVSPLPCGNGKSAPGDFASGPWPMWVRLIRLSTPTVRQPDKHHEHIR